MDVVGGLWRPYLGHGTQPGRVNLKQRKMRVQRPRLRKKGCGARRRGSGASVRSDAARCRHRRADVGDSAQRGFHAALSTGDSRDGRNGGVSRSAVSREAIEASEAALKKLAERRFEDVDLLVIYIDGMHFGEQCVLAAIGVDGQGRKHVLALKEAATENAEASKDLLAQLVSQGVDPKRRRLFVIDGSKALRTAINAVFGEHPIQRCRNHKLRNVLGRLPRDQQAQTGSLMRAAWKLGEKEGMNKFRQIATWLQPDYPDAARSLLEGLEECFNINRLDVPRSLHRCLATSNVVDNPHSGVRRRTRRVCRWRPGMPARWSAAAFVESQQSYRNLMGYRDLWALRAILDGSQPATRQAVA